MCNLPQYWHPTLQWYICSNCLTYIDISLSPYVHRIHSWWCKFCGFSKYIMTGIHHHSIIQNSFIVLKILSVPPICPSLPFNSWKPQNFYCIHSFAFSRELDGPTYYAAFSYWLPSPGDTHFSFLHCISWLLGMYHGLFIHLSIDDILVASKFWYLSIKLLQTSVCKFLCGCKFSTPFGEYQGVLVLDYIKVCLIL